MVPLMSRIAWELSNKVANVVNIRTILREPPAQAKQKIVNAKDLLETWRKVWLKKLYGEKKYLFRPTFL